MIEIAWREVGGMEVKHIIGRVWEMLHCWGTLTRQHDYCHLIGRYYWERNKGG